MLNGNRHTKATPLVLLVIYHFTQARVVDGDEAIAWYVAQAVMSKLKGLRSVRNSILHERLTPTFQIGNHVLLYKCVMQIGYTILFCHVLEQLGALHALSKQQYLQVFPSKKR